MQKVKEFARRSSLFMVAFSLFGAWVVGDIALFTTRVSAAELTSRSLAVSSSAVGSLDVGNPGEGTNGARAEHTVTFTMATSGATINTIALIYCNSPLPQTSCTSSAAETGDADNLTSATVTDISGGGDVLGSSSWTLDTTTSNPTITNYGTCNGSTGTTRDNCVLLTSGSTGANTGTPTIEISYGGAAGDYMVNPTNDNEAFFVRIVAFSDSYSTVIDNGAVVNSTAEQIDITARVQEILNFSVGSPDDTDPGGEASQVPVLNEQCDPLIDDGGMELGDADGVLSFSAAYDAYSFFRVSTNANNGTVVQYSGDTLQYSGNDIDAIGTTATASDVGTEQFGLAIDTTEADTDANTLDYLDQYGASGEYAGGGGTITDGGTAQFAFDTGSLTTPVELASTAGATESIETIVCDTATVRYLGNVATTTPPGIYTTTITYIAVPTY